MNYEMIKNNLLLFLGQYDVSAKSKYWQEQRKLFYDFWENKVKNNGYKELLRSDTDEVINIIDDNARGHNSSDREAIAKAGIYQNHWEKAFKDLKNKEDLRSTLDKILYTENDEDLAKLIDSLLFINRNNKNGMNGERMIMINAFLFLKNPEKCSSIISLYHRKLIIEKFGLASWPDNYSIGEQIVWSNKIILDGLHEKLGIAFTPRAISEFLYLPHGNYRDIRIKYLWYKKADKNKKDDKIFSELRLKPFARDESLSVKLKNEKEFNKGFIETQETNYEKGKIGEDFVIKYEKERLIKLGRSDLSDLIENKSNTNCGYDILSRNSDGSFRYIEVKSTERKKSNNFFITCKEIEASEKYGDNYYLYIVTEVKNNPRIKFYKKPNFFHNECFEMTPINYMVMYDQE